MDKVWHNIWIGTVYDACKHGSDFEAIVNVMELSELGHYEKQELFAHQDTIQIFSHFMHFERDPNEPEPRDGIVADYYADPMRLEKTCNLLYCLDTMGIKTLLHCAAGRERSPLAMIWYLHRYHDKEIEQAYELVKKAHPDTEYRLSWLKKLVPPPVNP